MKKLIFFLIFIPSVAKGATMIQVGTSAGGDLSGTYPNPTISTTTKATLGDNLGNHIATTTITANFGITTSTLVVTSTINANAISLFGGHIEISSTTPAISSCGSGPSPSIVGNDVAGTITIGGGVVTSCTLTFSKIWTNAPACTLASSSFITGQSASATTSALTISGSATFNGDSVMYLCFGQR